MASNASNAKAGTGMTITRMIEIIAMGATKLANAPVSLFVPVAVLTRTGFCEDYAMRLGRDVTWLNQSPF